MLQDRRLTDFILNIRSCGSASDAYALFTSALKDLGITESAYIMLLAAEDYVGFSNYNEAFCAAYDAAGGVAADFTAAWALKNEQPLVWQDKRNLPLLTPDNLKIEEVSRDFNINYGFTIPVKTEALGYWGGIGLAATSVTEREFQNDILRHADTVVALSAVFDMKMRQFSGSQLMISARLGNLSPLRSEERETLKWLSEGLSIKQIADEKLYKSIDSINVYIRSAKKKLKARNRDQLIARALVLKLIY